jgi:hypothetical protein
VKIDHLFVFVEPPATEAAELEQAGLRESFRRRHPGQGTTNACFCFDNAYLELLWVVDLAEMAAPAVARTGLAGRADWRRTGGSPFGIALRTAADDEAVPFETWDYRAPFLPEGLSIPVARSSDDPCQPFLFRSPGSLRPDAWTDGRAGLRQRPAGLAEITGVHLEFPIGASPADDYRWLADAGLLTFGRGAAGHRMVLTLSYSVGSHSAGGPPRRLSLPDFSWN